MKSMTCGCLGDSITYGLKGTSWVTRLSELCGFSHTTNYGVSGEKVAEIAARVSDMESGLDVITVWGGVNDFLWGEDTLPDFQAQYDTLISALRIKYPDAHILGITPMKFRYDALDAKPKSRAWNQARPDGLLLKNYVDAERTVLDKYKIPCLDLFSAAYFTPENPQHIHMLFAGEGDYLHPNTQGNLTVLAPKIANAINQML